MYKSLACDAVRIATGSQPFTDQSVIFDPAGMSAICAEVDVPAVEGDDRLARTAVLSILGKSLY